MDIKSVVDELVEVVKKDFVTILVCSLISVILSGISLGLLTFVFYTGMGLVFLKLKNNEKVDYKDLFTYINKFLYFIILSVIMGILIGLGLILLVIPGILLATLFIYAPFYLAYEDRGIIESLKLSYKTVLENNFVTHIIIFIILGIVNLIGANIFFIGLIVTYPVLVGFWVLFFNKIKIKG